MLDHSLTSWRDVEAFHEFCEIRDFADKFDNWKKNLLNDLEFLAVGNEKFENLFMQLEDFDLFDKPINTLNDIQEVEMEMEEFERKFDEFR